MCRVGWRTLTFTPHRGNDRITQCDSVYMARHPGGSFIASPLLLLEAATPEKKKINSFDAVIHMQENPPHKAVLSRTELILHATRATPHGASRLVQTMSAWSVKTGRAPS